MASGRCAAHLEWAPVTFTLNLMGSDQASIRSDRAALKLKYGALFENVSAILFKADLVGINLKATLTSTTLKSEQSCLGSVRPGLCMTLN